VNKLKLGKSGGPNRITTEHQKWDGETSSVALGCGYSIIKLGKDTPMDSYAHTTIVSPCTKGSGGLDFVKSGR